LIGVSNCRYFRGIAFPIMNIYSFH
jgi:hypothetical protein